jgi:hypothetical protein
MSVLYGNSSILSLTTANSLGFVNDVEGLAIEKGSKAFVRVFVLSSTLNRDSVQLKLENVRELGFKGEKGRIIV